MAQSSSGHDNVFVSKEELEYLYASNVNVANFVSVKLSGHGNYHIWKAQMLSLMDKLMIRDIVENRDAWLKSKSEDFVKKYDILLKGWILGSLKEEVLRHIDCSEVNERSIWMTLADEYCFRGYPTGLTCHSINRAGLREQLNTNMMNPLAKPSCCFQQISEL
ncbi:Ankyrin repeat-containing protein [Artemisia annua]|uniref:Ankyrin repeat-containing protein n=1 Tax=Artemisia annua TaxID=35608 RepID=A0A2U1N0C1_ARTAN|nr:Ankyrin repeat-containing protein [Artemisia annua]